MTLRLSCWPVSAAMLFLFGLLASTCGAQATAAAGAVDAQAIARDTLKALSTALGVADASRDFREVSARADRYGRAHVAYERVVAGLPLRGMELVVHVGAGGTVEGTSGVVSGLPAGTQESIGQAAARATLTEADVRAAVLRDLATGGRDASQVARFVVRKEALTSVPWVAWRVDVTLAGGRGRWIYDVDAVSGAILSRRDNLQSDGWLASCVGSSVGTSCVGSPGLAPLSHTTPLIYVARIVNMAPGSDGDEDGLPETFSFDVSIDADWGDAADTGYVAAVIRCITTGQMWQTDSWFTTGEADDPAEFDFTQRDLGLAVPENATLDFTVELWDPTFTTRFDTETTVVGEPVRADHILPGAKIGRGIGVRGNAYPHVDASYDDADYLFYLRDVSRRAGSDPHGHAGAMSASAVIVTGVYDPDTAFTAYDLDDVWSASYEGSAIDAHVGATVVYDYLHGSLGMNGIDGDGSSMLSLMDVPCASDNAFWDSGEVFYCEPIALPLSLAGALDVVAHEWGHAVTELGAQPRRNDLTYAGESGALNESFSDWFGTAVEHSRGETNWTLGEGIVIARDMSSPHAYGQPDTYLDDALWVPVSGCVPDEANDDCGVHENSGVPNKMFYLLSIGGAQGGVVVNGIGITTAMKIAFDANMFYWPSSATLGQARLGMLEAADPLGANDVNQVANAWAAVGVGLPAGSHAWGDVAPRAAPNGGVDIGDVVTALRFSVALDTPTSMERRRADVAPYDTIDATGTPRVIRVGSDGRIDIADVVVLLRVAVGLTAFGT